MVTAADREWCSRRDDVQTAMRVERVRQPEQVDLVGAAAVVEDDQPGRLAGGGPLPVRQGGYAAPTGEKSAPSPSSSPSSATAALVVRKRTTPSRGARISSSTSPNRFRT